MNPRRFHVAPPIASTIVRMIPTMLTAFVVCIINLPLRPAPLLTAGGTTGSGSLGFVAGSGSGFRVGSIDTTLPPFAGLAKGGPRLCIRSLMCR